MLASEDQRKVIEADELVIRDSEGRPRIRLAVSPASTAHRQPSPVIQLLDEHGNLRVELEGQRNGGCLTLFGTAWDGEKTQEPLVCLDAVGKGSTLVLWEATGSAQDDDLLGAVRLEVRAGLGTPVKLGLFDEQEVPVLELPSADVSELSRRVACVINEWCRESGRPVDELPYLLGRLGEQLAGARGKGI